MKPDNEAEALWHRKLAGCSSAHSFNKICSNCHCENCGTAIVRTGSGMTLTFEAVLKDNPIPSTPSPDTVEDQFLQALEEIEAEVAKQPKGELPDNLDLSDVLEPADTVATPEDIRAREVMSQQSFNQTRKALKCLEQIPDALIEIRTARDYLRMGLDKEDK